MKTKVKIIGDGKAPYKKHEDDACFDLFAREIVYENDHTVTVKLGVCIEPSTGFRVALYPRSSLSKSGWVLGNSVGVGDNNYRGEYQAVFVRVLQDYTMDIVYSSKVHGAIPDYHPFPYKVGDRCIQFEVVRYYSPSIEIVDELSNTSRGSGGFGSTGKT
jgi:dUTP pyrophosphatase